jgi:hypothetical protein
MLSSGFKKVVIQKVKITAEIALMCIFYVYDRISGVTSSVEKEE